VDRESLLAWYRWVILGVVLVLAGLTFLFLRGPAAFQRLYYPLPEEYRPLVAASAEKHRVNPYLMAALIHGESRWKPNTVSRAGAVGLVQILPSTAADMSERVDPDLRIPAASGRDGVDPDALRDPAANIEYGSAYLRLLVERYHEIEPALAAYNAGMSNVDAWLEQGDDIRETIEFPETRHYVLRVIRARDVYERLYPDAFE
jgi:soluble lytic murein transglycosylase